VRGIPAAAGLVRRKMQPQMNTDQKEINTVGSVDILKKRQRCLKRYRLKLSPRSRVWRIRLRSDRPGARAQSLRFSEEKGSRSERDAGKAVVGMPGVFPRALGGCARFLSALGGNHALRPTLLRDVGMISLAVDSSSAKTNPMGVS
jgi:hypothetical protein